MTVGLLFLAAGLYLFILTYYTGKIAIILISSFARFFNGVVGK